MLVRGGWQAIPADRADAAQLFELGWRRARIGDVLLGAGWPRTCSAGHRQGRLQQARGRSAADARVSPP
jgi:hypothetical protein